MKLSVALIQTNMSLFKNRKQGKSKIYCKHFVNVTILPEQPNAVLTDQVI
jgi:hypothetical protein